MTRKIILSKSQAILKCKNPDYLEKHAREFFDALHEANFAFHPDTLFDEYVDREGKQCFTNPAHVEQLNSAVLRLEEDMMEDEMYNLIHESFYKFNHAHRISSVYHYLEVMFDTWNQRYYPDFNDSEEYGIAEVEKNVLMEIADHYKEQGQIDDIEFIDLAGGHWAVGFTVNNRSHAVVYHRGETGYLLIYKNPNVEEMKGFENWLDSIFQDEHPIAMKDLTEKHPIINRNNRHIYINGIHSMYKTFPPLQS